MKSRRLVALVFLCLMVAACATEDDLDDQADEGQSEGEDEANATESDAGEGGGDELVVGAPQDRYSLSPEEVATVGMFFVNGSVFESLTTPTPSMELEPGLATDWEFIEPDTWRFELREDVVFHNGEDFDAGAVAWTINERIAEQGFIAGINENSAEVVDSHTVDIATDPLNFRLPRRLSNPYYAIVAPETHPGDASDAASTPTGTGPFEFGEYTPEESLVVDRFDEYWGEAPPLRQITFRFLPDASSRVLALRSGDVDAIYEVPRGELESLQDDDTVEVALSRPGAYYGLFFNANGDAPYDHLNDEQVRRAIAHALDVETIVENVWRGSAVRSQAFVPPEIMGEDNVARVEGHEYDPELARNLLDEAGWTLSDEGVRTKDGRELRVINVPFRPEEEEPLPELMEAQLRDVGIALEIQPAGDMGGWGDVMDTGEFHITSQIANAGIEHPGGPIGWISQGVGGEGGAAQWVGPGEDFDDRSAGVLEMREDNEYHTLLASLYQEVVDEHVTALPFANVSRIYATAPHVAGFEPYSFVSSQQWHTVRLES